VVLYQLAKYKSEAKPQWKIISKPNKPILRKNFMTVFFICGFSRKIVVGPERCILLEQLREQVISWLSP